MKHLHNFDTVAEYEAVKDTLEMPYIVSIDETDGLPYNTEVIRVPQGSAGSGGEWSVRSSWRYFDVSKSPMQPGVVTLYPALIKLLGSTEIKHITAIINDGDALGSIGAFGVDGDGILAVLDGVVYTWNEAMALEGMTPEAVAQMNVIEISEEEFLNKTFE